MNCFWVHTAIVCISNNHSCSWRLIQYTHSENPNGALVRHGPSLHCTLGQKMNSLNGIFMPPTEIILFFASQWFLFWFRENWCWWTHKIVHGNTDTQRSQAWNTKESMGRIEQISLLLNFNFLKKPYFFRIDSGPICFYVHLKLQRNPFVGRGLKFFIFRPYGFDYLG